MSQQLTYEAPLMNGVRVNTTARSERLHIVNGAKETEAMQRKWKTQGRTQWGTTCEVRKHEKPQSESKWGKGHERKRVTGRSLNLRTRREGATPLRTRKEGWEEPPAEAKSPGSSNKLPRRHSNITNTSIRNKKEEEKEKRETKYRVRRLTKSLQRQKGLVETEPRANEPQAGSENPGTTNHLL